MESLLSTKVDPAIFVFGDFYVKWKVNGFSFACECVSMGEVGVCQKGVRSQW